MKHIRLFLFSWLLTGSVCTFADFTIGVIPDTQNMAESNNEAAKITKMLKYFVDNKEELNVIFVASVGDMTQNNNVDSEWQRLFTAYDQLNDAGIPFAPCHGNHDGISGINKWFPVSDFENTPTWGGSMNGGIENAWYKFSAEGNDFVLVVGQYNGGNSVFNWANETFSDNMDRRGIFVAHHIDNGTDYETEVVTQNNNIFLSLSGHRGPPPNGREETWFTETPDGSTITNVMTDYQGGWEYNDKGATIRWYTFKTEQDQVCAFTWNTTHEVFETDEESEFCWDYDLESGAGTLYTLTLPDVPGGTITTDQGAGTEFEPGTEVMLTAEPDEGYVFEGWGGDLTGSENPLTITITADMNISADFAEEALSIRARQNRLNLMPSLIKGSFDLSGFTRVESITLFDINGKSIFEKSIFPGQVSVSLGGLPKGQYLVKIFARGVVFDKTIRIAH